MKAIMVMYDSLIRHMLPNYGCDWVHAPNFKRLGEMAVTFDNCYAGSLPCIPARRELHTGRYNFLHRSWGPLEPFDDSMPDMLKKSGVYTHLISDHVHYWGDGGATYHTRYSSWEISRGQTGDPWKGEVANPEYPDYELSVFKDMGVSPPRQDVVNRKYMDEESKQPQAKTFEMGLEFIGKNKDADNWFLQIETFDPHEPFFTQQHYKDLYPHEYNGKFLDWPPYYFVQESDEVAQHARCEYAALLSMCDTNLGRVLDMMDTNDLWKDTMLIVNTDHGYLLGEHGWWAKMIMPDYNEIAHTPLFVWDPRAGVRGQRRNALVQTVDLAPTLLDFFGVKLSEGMEGRPLRRTIETDAPVREAALFGHHGGHVNCTDGRYVYMRGPAGVDNVPLFDYTLMPTHMWEMFKVSELQDIQLAEPFGFTKGCRTMKIRPTAFQMSNPFNFGSKLFDLQNDPAQTVELDDPQTECRMIRLMTELMRQNDAPKEQYERLGIPQDGCMSVSGLMAQREQYAKHTGEDFSVSAQWTDEARAEFRTLMNMTPEPQRKMLLDGFKTAVTESFCKEIDENFVLGFMKKTTPKEMVSMTTFLLRLAGKKK